METGPFLKAAGEVHCFGKRRIIRNTGGLFFIPLVEIYSLYDHSSFGSRKFETIEI